MVPILQEQQEFLRNELAQPLPTLTRTTNTHHLRAQAEPQPKPTLLSPQQEAARLGITPEELATIGEDSIREQAEWIAKDEAKWKERKEMRWWGEVREVREDRERGGQENRKGAEEVEQQEWDETTQEDTTIEHPQSAPPPPAHLIPATQQLGLTPEEAQEVHNKCVRTQKEIQREFEEEDQVRRDRIAKADAHPDEMKRVPTHPAAHSQPALNVYEMPYEPPQATTSLDSGSIDHRDPLDHTGRYQLPTPAAHSQPTPRVYETPYKPPMVAMPYDDDNIVMSNRGDTPPGGYQPQLPNPTSNAQPPLQPPDHDPHSTSFGYHENEGDIAPMEPDWTARARDVRLGRHRCKLGRGDGWDGITGWVHGI
jgi:hypothetical protein